MQISAAITEKPIFTILLQIVIAIVKNMLSVPLFYGLMFIIRLYLNVPFAYLFYYNEL